MRTTESIYACALRLMEKADAENRQELAELYAGIVDAIDAMHEPDEKAIRKALRKLVG